MPDPSRVQPIIDYKLPESVLELRTFLGMVNFIRRNIRRAADIQYRLQFN